MFPRLPKVFRIFYMGLAFLSLCSFFILRELASRKKQDMKLIQLSSSPARDRQEVQGEKRKNINIDHNNINKIINSKNKNSFLNGLLLRGNNDLQSKDEIVKFQNSLWNNSSLLVPPEIGLPYNASQIINPSLLCASDNFVIVYIHTAPNNFKRRMAIRQTWGDKKLLGNLKIRLVFVMGVVDSPRVMDMVKLESDRYNDIMQSVFRDSYRNLNFKAMAALRWIATYCHNTTYILKTDDDILVNIFLLAKQLTDLHQHNFGQEDFIMCNVWTGMRVIRDRRSKWFVSRKEFPKDTYPSYCSGSAYVMSPDMAVRLFKKSLTIPFFWIDDVYVTGVLVKALGIKHVRFNSAYVLDSGKVLDRFFKDTTRTLVFYHVHGYKTMYTLWQRLKERMNAFSTEQTTFSINRTPGHR
ncbi:beta-1,3-galactosyltransferase 5 [Octopus sinensis]|uniref:Hexosyltransferase n=1 Tax=Octopus sinensis TaxID=2607531 RepID=A0A7E6EZR3_9MOLL|nr:beta-1,3-galactosyltransferase 5 [Octopus sinensis]XP_036360215.1 beta-1,3-galactosyltransferase 5 [Octopus sinensis]XP_036360216.1 beta-1,3-galactosyltransferase 5 [Octopus sinensis]XP_036360217.1 beta-1,3-galactosyltransferase 5 [Octopus sinensis]